MANLPSACVIGAGSSGIAALKALSERGIPVDCYECSDRVGGNWVFANPNGMSSAYRSLHTNTSREQMAYSDFPMPRAYPDFPHHTQIARYFSDYASRFGLTERIRFNTGVEHAARDPADGTWIVTLDTGETRRYDALVVANGHHWDPRWPEPAYPGSFAGEQIHSHWFVDASGFRDKNVLVVGIGNSAADIAVESSFGARRVFLSARRSAHVVPKYIFGRPLDQIGASPLSPLVPFRVRQAFFRAVYRVGEYRLPPRAEMEADMLREHERMRRRFVASKRHTMEVDFDDYLFAVRRELGAGARRARQAGFGLPVASSNPVAPRTPVVAIAMASSA